MAEDRALPNLKARLSIDTSDAQRAQAAVQQARTGIQGMIADAKSAAEATRSATAAQRAEAAEFASTLTKGGAGSGVAAAGDQAVGATTKIRNLSAAATSMGEAFGGGAAEATRFASVLAYGAFAAAFAIGVAKLAEFGEGLNHTKLSLQELKDLAGKTSAQDLVGSTITAFTFGDIDAQLKQLAESGATGVGTLLNLRDAYIAAGRPVDAFDKALEEARVSLLNTGTATERGKAQLDAWGVGADSAKDAADRLAEASRRLETATSNQASAGASLLTSQSSVLGAENRLRDAKEKLANFGTQASSKSIREARDEAAAVESASQRIIDDQQRIVDARQKVADAQEALAHAGEHERLDVQDAQDAVDAAQRKVNASSPEERGPAQHALEDAQQKLVDAKRALDSAKPDAERALADAVRGVDDAMRSEADAHRQLADAQDRQNESTAKAAESQGSYRDAVDAVTEAQLALAAAQAGQMDLLAQLAGRVDGPVSKLGNLKAALRQVADELDPSSDLTKRVLFVLAALGGVELPTIQIATPGKFKQSARGNHLAAFEPSIVGDKFGLDRAELFVPDVPGTVVPQGGFGGFGGRGDHTDNSQNLEQHLHFHGDVDPAKASRTARRELERFAILAAR